MYCKADFSENICPLIVAEKAAINANQVSHSAYCSVQLVNLHYWRTEIIVLRYRTKRTKNSVLYNSKPNLLSSKICIAFYTLSAPFQANVRILYKILGGIDWEMPDIWWSGNPSGLRISRSWKLRLRPSSLTTVQLNILITRIRPRKRTVSVP